MRLSNSQIETIRTRPQKTQLYLSIFQPRTIFQAQVNDVSIAKGARSITFDTVSLGSYLDIESGFTMLIGTIAGSGNIGKIRVRSATSTVITVSENSNIAWADNLFLTVQRYVELWPIFPRIIENPANISDSIFYKDYDIPYSNQNSILGTYVNAGPHRADWIHTGSVSFYYSSTGTYNLLGDSLNYNWSFEGGTPTGSASADPGFISYNTAGHYVTRLIVSGSSGEIDTTYRYVSVYDDAHPPVLKWEVTNLSGSRDESGYQASFKVYENIPIDENSVIVLFSDDWYGNNHTSLGGNYPNAERIFFVGHILQDSIHYDYQHSYIEFSVGSITELMKQSLGFSVSVESKINPSKWYELLDMDGRRALYHYLRWHTTAMNIADFQFVGTDYKIQFFDADRTSMFDALDNYMRNTLIGKTVADRQGKVWMEVDAKAYPNPTGTFTSVMDISKRDWLGEPNIEERLSDDYSYIEYGGIAYSGVNTGTFSALLASAPGNSPSFRGKLETHEGLAILGQDQLNTMVGNVWANEVFDYPKVSMDMTESLRNLDIAPQETCDINILSSDTIRNLAIHNLYNPNGMTWKYDANNSILLPSIEFTSLVNGTAGELIAISTDSAGIDSGFSVPGLQIPPLPALTFPGLAGNTTGSSCCDYFLALGLGMGVYCCLYTKAGATPENIFGDLPFGWEYASNPNMYTASNGHMPFLNTGTITYNVTIEGSFSQTGDPASQPGPEMVYVSILTNTSTSVIAFFIGQQGYNGVPTVDTTATGIGSVINFKKTGTITNSSCKSPNYMVAYISGNANPVRFKGFFSHLRFTICDT